MDRRCVWLHSVPIWRFETGFGRNKGKNTPLQGWFLGLDSAQDGRCCLLQLLRVLHYYSFAFRVTRDSSTQFSCSPNITHPDVLRHHNIL